MENLDFQSLEIDDFSGGITDFPFKANLNQFAELDNILLDVNKKPFTRPGSDSYIDGFPNLTTGPMRIHNITVMQNKDVYVAAEDRVLYEAPSGWYEVHGPNGEHVYSEGAGSSVVKSSFAEWNGHLYTLNDLYSIPSKIFINDSGDPTTWTAGLPVMPDTFTFSTLTGSDSYIYYITYVHTYMVGNTTFEVESSPGIKNIINAGEIGPFLNTIGINNIPVLSNGTGENYDISNIKKKIYRTTSGGNVAYLVDTIDNSSIVYYDSKSDETIQNNNVVFYGSSGTRYYDPPPKAKYIHVLNGRAYYAYILENLDERPFTIKQSIQDLPDAVPEDFEINVRDHIVGISSFSNNLIVFGTTKIYRIDGYFDEKGRGGPTYDEISKITGTINNNSIVQTNEGVFFAGNSGFFFTDGFKVMKISENLDVRYNKFLSIPNAKDKIFGVYDPLNRRIHWALQQNGDSNENDTIFSLDLKHGVSSSSVFTTMTGGTYFRPSALGVKDDVLIRGQSQGFVLRHENSYFNDPKIDPLKNYKDWDKNAIIYRIKTSGMNFGLPQIRKWVTRVLTTIRNISNLSLQIISINDDSSVEKELKPIRFRNSVVWGDPFVVWGDPTLIWFFQGLIENVRRFPKNGLRCSYKQLLLTNAEVIITNSDLNCPINFDTNTLIATLTNPFRTLTFSSITNINVGNLVEGVVTGAKGIVKQIVNASLQLEMVSGNFTGETGLNNLTVSGNASISNVSPLIKWLDDILDFKIQMQPLPQEDNENYPVTLPIAQRIDDYNLLLDNTNGALNQYLSLNFNNIKWYMVGIPKTEKLQLESLVLYYAPLTPSQRQYKNDIRDMGTNRP